MAHPIAECRYIHPIAQAYTQPFPARNKQLHTAFILYKYILVLLIFFCSNWTNWNYSLRTNYHYVFYSRLTLLLILYESVDYSKFRNGLVILIFIFSMSFTSFNIKFVLIFRNKNDCVDDSEWLTKCWLLVALTQINISATPLSLHIALESGF